MFRCQLCSLVPAAGTPSVRVVVEARTKTYRFRPKANRIVRLDARGKPKEVFIDDPGGVGREVAREVVACPDCAARLKSPLPGAVARCAQRGRRRAGPKADAMARG